MRHKNRTIRITTKTKNVCSKTETSAPGKPLETRHKGAGPGGHQHTPIYFKKSADSRGRASSFSGQWMLPGLREAAIYYRTSSAQKPMSQDITPYPARDESTSEPHLLHTHTNGICGWLKVES